MRAWLIVNPTAGAGQTTPDQADLQGRTVVEQLRALAGEHGLEVRETLTEHDAVRLGREAVEQKLDRLIAAGGDGTISAVINGMSADFDATPLAIVPLGTANDFASTLGLSMNPAAALALALGGIERRVDLIHCDTDGGRYVINASTGGFSELVHKHLDPDLKRRWGALAYLRAGLDAMPEVCSHRVRLRIDDQPMEVDVCSIVVANGRSAGGFQLAPEADVADRRLDLLLVTAQTLLERMRLASQFVVGAHLASEELIFRRADHVRIDADPPMQFSSDGELIGRTPISFRVVPAALRVMVAERAG